MHTSAVRTKDFDSDGGFSTLKLWHSAGWVLAVEQNDFFWKKTQPYIGKFGTEIGLVFLQGILSAYVWTEALDKKEWRWFIQTYSFALVLTKTKRAHTPSTRCESKGFWDTSCKWIACRCDCLEQCWSLVLFVLSVDTTNYVARWLAASSSYIVESGRANCTTKKPGYCSKNCSRQERTRKRNQDI